MGNKGGEGEGRGRKWGSHRPSRNATRISSVNGGMCRYYKGEWEGEISSVNDGMCRYCEGGKGESYAHSARSEHPPHRPISSNTFL